VDAYPNSVCIKNNDGNRPLEVVAAPGLCSKDVIDYLEGLMQRMLNCRSEIAQIGTHEMP